MSNTIRYRRSEQIVMNKIDDEIVMMDLGKGSYYNLNKVGSCIWEQLEEKKSLQEIVQVVFDVFDVSEDLCREKVAVFLEKMKSMGIVETV